MHFKLHIPEPCNEDWLQMTPSEQGKFCSSCKKEVIDFTLLSRKEITAKVKSGKSICGRYRKDQLETTYFIPEKKPFKYLGVAAAFTSLMALCEPAMGQDREVKTEQKDQNTKNNDQQFIINEEVLTFNIIITDESDLPLPGVFIQLMNSEKTYKTDFDGKATIVLSAEEHKKYNKIQCSYVGFDLHEFELTNSGNRTHQLILAETLSGEILIIESNRRTKKPRSRWSRWH